ncbi:HpcH/HpaI aldolase/citrate lyase family protein [Achromobacter aegrifaciens]|uniref:HpcH/HpaI aldolase/citrate lyase family protein n=1 Tax=Achromobacter aegrifaciens TaxID=1287736 RepID=UPI000F748067|nr:CoA ester lyase [Achromobacter aegrifaciens]RSF03240.1 CoA ester lyase [Achromobacter aegrifaciens]
MNIAQERPFRSVLYMPGANPRARARARELDADAVILDLEDAVAVSAKEEARRLVEQTLRQGGFGRRSVVVRVNGLDTPWGRADVRAGAPLRPDALLLPKVERPEQLAAVAELLGQCGVTDLPLWAMVETPRAILNLAAIASAGPPLRALVAGTSDLVKDLHARHTPARAEAAAALSLTVRAARAHGLLALDGVHLELDDAAGLQAACRQGRDLGFDGKTLIHPRQIAAANAAFGMSEADIEQAQAVIAAWGEALARGSGVAVVDGKLVEALHVDEARRVLALARAIASP